MAPDTRRCTAAALAVANAALGPDFRKGGGYGANPCAAESWTREEQASDRNTRAGACDRKDAARRRRRSEPADDLSDSGPAGDVRINPAPPGSSAFHIAAARQMLLL